MIEITSALEDPRPIATIEMCGTTGCDGDYYTTKYGNTIHAYSENGQGARVPWFAIIEDGVIKTRLNGAFVTCVTYDE